jgi:CheY-like chemotaxis protein
MGASRQRPLAWVVDDAHAYRLEISKEAKKAGLRVHSLADEEQFHREVVQVGIDRLSAPRIVILDLRLGDQKGDIRAIDSGIRCLETLRSEDATKEVPVVVYSFMVNNKPVKKALAKFRDVQIVDKRDKQDLYPVIVNQLGDSPFTLRQRMASWWLAGERWWSRVAWIVAATLAILALVVGLIDLFG